MEHSDVQHENRQKLLFQSPFAFFYKRFSLFPKPFLSFGGGFHGGFPSHLYTSIQQNPPPKKKKLVESFLGLSLPLVQSCTNLYNKPVGDLFLGMPPSKKTPRTQAGQSGT